jgi:hypothetical protein
VTGTLAAEQRRRRDQAEQCEREAVVPYDVVRRIGDPDRDRALSRVAERLAEAELDSPRRARRPGTRRRRPTRRSRAV